MSQSPLLLALDTATATASAAIYDLGTGRLLSESTWLARRKQTQELMAAAQAMLRQLEIEPEQLSALAVTTGPGSFTGVRIAISAAKGIGLGLPVLPRVVGIPTLCVTAAPWLEILGRIHPSPLLCAALQAGRGRYNWCFWGPGEVLRRPTAAEHGAGTVEEFAAVLAAHAPRTVWLAGELAQDIVKTAGELPHLFVMDAVASWRRAGFLAQLAAWHLAAGNEDDLATLQPLYLQGPA